MQRKIRPGPIVIVLLLICFPACQVDNQEAGDAQRSLPPAEAIALHDSAMALYSPLDTDSADVERMVALLDSAIAIDSSYRRAYLNKAFLLNRYGRTQEAIATMRAWLEEHPNDHNARLLRARYGNDTKEMRAVARIKRARMDSLIHLYPDSIALKAYRPIWEYLAGNRNEAIAEMDSLAARNSNSQVVKSARQILTDSSAMAALGGYPMAILTDSMWITKLDKGQQ